MDKTRTLRVRVWCQASYDSEIQVPADLSLKEAFEYASEHLDEIPLTQLEYLPDSDSLDENDLDNPYATSFAPEKNTKLSYFHNGKILTDYGVAIIPGTLTNKEKRCIWKSMDKNGTFIPTEIGLPADTAWTSTKPLTWILSGIEETTQEPNCSISTEQLVQRFQEHKGKWTDLTETKERKHL